MQFFDDTSIQIAIFILGLCGFFVARRIHSHKTKNTPLVCPIGFDCHAVVHSDYSKFFDIPVEIFGMIYYVFTSFVYLVLTFSFIKEVMLAYVLMLMTFISFLAFIFSIYLIFIQIFILKKGCSWCIVSSLISSLIFILTLFNFY